MSKFYRSVSRKKVSISCKSLFFLIFVILLVEILTVEHFFSSENLQIKRNSIEYSDKNHRIINKTKVVNENADLETKFTDKRSLEGILRATGIQVDDELKRKLPPLVGVIEMYGPNPVFVGKDSCKSFQSSTKNGNRFTGPAGLFNTGTNLLDELLTENCNLTEPEVKNRTDSNRKDSNENNSDENDSAGDNSADEDSADDDSHERSPTLFQVPWGKHNPVSYREKNKEEMFEQVLPVVMIKDPYTWMESMCRHEYEASWDHSFDHCPNLVPITEQEQSELGNDKTFKLDVYFRDDPIEYDSLVHLWSEWYQDWFNADFPRLMIRYEDLLFHTETVIKEVCTCAGGTLYDKPFVYVKDSAKGEEDEAHQGGNGLVQSILKYGFPENRVKSYVDKDLEYAEDHLNHDLMEMFHYNFPGIKETNKS